MTASMYNINKVYPIMMNLGWISEIISLHQAQENAKQLNYTISAMVGIWFLMRFPEPRARAPHPQCAVVRARHENLGVHWIPGDAIDGSRVAGQFGYRVFTKDVVDVDLVVLAAWRDEAVVRPEAAVDGVEAWRLSGVASNQTLFLHAPQVNSL